jgi:hypothetical protein
MEATMGSKKQEQSLVGQHGVRDGGTGLPRVPSVATSPAGATSTAKATEPRDADQESVRQAVFGNRTKVVTLPMSDAELGGHFTRLVQVRLTRAQGIALKRLRLGLENAGAQLEDGSEVADNSKAIRWLLEQVANDA